MLKWGKERFIDEHTKVVLEITFDVTNGCRSGRVQLRLKDNVDSQTNCIQFIGSSCFNCMSTASIATRESLRARRLRDLPSYLVPRSRTDTSCCFYVTRADTKHVRGRADNNKRYRTCSARMVVSPEIGH